MAFKPRAKFEVVAEDKTAVALRSAQARMDRFGKNVQKSLAGVAASFAAAFTAGALARRVFETAKGLEEVARQAEALGASTTSIQELTQTFREFQLDSNDVSDALGTLVDRARDAEGGMKSFIDDFKLIGVSVDDLRGKSPEELFSLVADRISQVGDAGDRTAGIVRIFGDDLGRRLNPLLIQGSAGLKEYAERWHEAGLIVDEAGIEKSAEASEAIRDMNRHVDALALNLTEALAPAISRVAANWNDLITTTEQERIGRLNEDINRIQDRLATLADKRETFGAVPQIVEEQERLANLLLDKKNELDAIFARQRDQQMAEMEKQFGDAGGDSGTAAGQAFVLSFEQELARLNLEIPGFGDMPGSDRLIPKLTADQVFPVGEIVDGAFRELEDEAGSTAEVIAGEFDGLARGIGMSLHRSFSDAFLGIETSFGDMLARIAADWLSSQLLKSLGAIIPGSFGQALSEGLPGFRDGGSFTVGGSGGPDSQLVAFRASPGERVTVSHDRASPGGATVIEQHFHVQAGLPPMWTAQLATVGQLAGAHAEKAVSNRLGGRR